MPKNFVSKIIRCLVKKQADANLLYESKLFSESPNENVPQINDIKRFKLLLSTIIDRLNVDDKIKKNIHEGLNHLTEKDPNYTSCGVFPFLHEDNDPYSEIGTFDLLEPVSIKNFSQPAGKCEVRQSPEITGVADNVFRYFACYLKEIKVGSFDITGQAVTSNNYGIGGGSCSLSILISVLADILDKKDKIQRVTASGEIKADFNDCKDALLEVSGFGHYFFSKLEAAYCYGSKILVLPETEKMYTLIAKKSENHALSFLFKQVNDRLYYGLEGKLEDNLEIIYVKNIPDILDKVFDVFSEEDFKQAIEKKLPTHLKKYFIHRAKKYFSFDELTEMKDVYVEVKLIEEIKKKLENRDPEDRSEKEKNNNPEDEKEKESTPEFPIDIFKKKGSFSIVGPPGSGKTSILKNLGLKFIESDNYIPIFIKLHKFNHCEILPSIPKYINKEKGDGLSLSYLNNYLKYSNQTVKDFLNNDKDKIVLLLDGFDEFSGKIKMLYDWMRNSEYKIIITSRVNSGLSNGLPTYICHDFKSELLKLINNIVLDKTRISELKEYLDKNNEFNDNPLFIALMCIIWNNGPENITEIRTSAKLIEQFFNRLIDDWPESKLMSEKHLYKVIEKNDVRPLLKTIAFMMHCKAKYNSTISDLKDWIINKSQFSEESIQKIMKDITKTGLLINSNAGDILENGTNAEYRFVHPLFQEYLAAGYMATMTLEDIKWFIKTKTLKTKEPNGWKYNYLKQEFKGKEVYPMMYLHDPHWEQVLIYLTHIMKSEDSRKLIKSILKGELNNNSIKMKVIDKYLKSDLILATKLNRELDKDIIEILKKLMNDDNSRIRIHAAEALGKIGRDSQEVIDVLIKALNDKDYYVQDAAAEALGKIGRDSKEVIEALIKTLNDDAHSVRSAAAKTLGQIGKDSKEVIDALIKTLNDEYLWVQIAAAEALGQIGKDSKEVTDALIKTLNDESYWVQIAAAEALVKIGRDSKEVIDALIKTLNDDAHSVRSAAAKTLGQIGKDSKEVIDALIKALNDYWVQDAAAEALGKIGRDSKEVTDALIKTLNDESYCVQIAAAKTLGKIGKDSKEVIDALIKALNDKDYSVRSAAAKTLGKIGKDSKEVTDALIKTLNDEYLCVRSAAAEALGQIGKDSKEVTDALIKALNDERYLGQSAAAKTLGKIGKDSKEVIDALIKALNDKDYSVRSAAAEALGQIGKDSKEVIDALIKAFNYKYYRGQIAAAKALGQIGKDSKEVIDALIKALNDNDYRVQRAAKEELGKIGKDSKEVTDALIKTLNDNNSDVRRFAAEALGQIGKDSKEVTDALIKTLNDESYCVQIAAAKTLGKIGKDSKEVTDALIKTLNDEYLCVQIAAAEALGQIGKDSKEAIEALIKALNDKDYWVRQNAARVLGKIGNLEIYFIIKNYDKKNVIYNIWEKERKNKLFIIELNRNINIYIEYIVFESFEFMIYLSSFMILIVLSPIIFIILQITKKKRFGEKDA